ncbi:MAG TPA: prolyl oligopeptidase family serine peptidase [Caldilineaceae bacterium]|nr:prolyl oligopeptidase family serine peptidase [Caldilineaceae bacterium]
MTDNAEAIHRFGAWSRDGKSLLYTSNAHNQIDFDLYRMEIATGAAEMVRECSGRREVVGWSNDGRYVLNAEEVASEQVELFLLDLATDEERHLTAGLPAARYYEVRWVNESVYLLTDRTHDRGALCRLALADGGLEIVVDTSAIDEYTIANSSFSRDDCGFGSGVPPVGELEQLAVSPDGSRAAVGVNVEGYSRLFLIDLKGGASVQPVRGLPDGVTKGLRFSPDGERLLFSHQTPLQPEDIWTLELASSALTQHTFSNRAGIAAALIHFAAFDGRRIPAFYYRPQTPSPPGGYPCILYVHGGPASQQRPDFDVRFQYFLRSISPLHKAERIRCPLLVMAGDNDPRVPLYESQQIVERVRAANGTVEFIHYADEGHNFSKLANRIDSFTKMAEFLNSHLGNGVA